MTSFEERLKAAIVGINSQFQAADDDLHEVVAEASMGIQRVTEGAAKLVLVKTEEKADEAHYEVRLESDAQQTKTLLNFIVSRRGYPIQSPGERPLHIPNKEALKKVFDDMAANPDSALVVHLAFFMRQAQKTPA